MSNMFFGRLDCGITLTLETGVEVVITLWY